MAIDQQRFGQFVAALRKEKGWTQKQLAARIGVSDKAVSKWERALSLPDISLLEPLAAALGVTVAELLHGERLAAPLEPQQVEALVTGAVQLGQRGFHSDPLRRLRWLGVLAAGVLVLLAEWAAGAALSGRTFAQLFADPAAAPAVGMPLLAAGMGVLLCFLPDTLPAYYDQYEVDGLSYGPVRLHLPGVRFTNRNWPYVKRAGLRAMLALLVGLYPLELALRALLPSLPALAYPMVSLLALLGGLFGAMTAAAVRHADPPASAKAPVLYAVALVVALAAVLALGGTGGYGVWTGAVQQKLPGSWRAQYAFFEGTRSGSLGARRFGADRADAVRHAGCHRHRRRRQHTAGRDNVRRRRMAAGRPRPGHADPAGRRPQRRLFRQLCWPGLSVRLYKPARPVI